MENGDEMGNSSVEITCVWVGNLLIGWIWIGGESTTDEMWIITNLGYRALLSRSRSPVQQRWMGGRIRGERDYQSRGMDRILFPQSLRLNGR